MLTTVQAALAGRLAPGEPVLVGVSGGADSVALLAVLIRLGWRPHVCHLNHQLRGDASDGDAEFVRQLAGRFQAPVSVAACDVGALAAQQERSLEETARLARHRFFAAVAARTGISTLALAHTADDQAETLLLRLLRGAGTLGLAGIWPERQLGPLRVIRPLLAVRRAEILEYLALANLAWREDASNRDRRFLRNRVRHELLPLLEREYNPSIRAGLGRTAEILRADEEALDRQVAETVFPAICQGAAVNVTGLAGQPLALQRRVLRVWLAVGDELGSFSGIGFDHLEAVRQLAASGAVRGEVELPGDWVVYREGDWLRQGRRQDPEPVRGRWAVVIGGETVIRELGVRFRTAVVAAATAAIDCEAPVDRSGGKLAEHLDLDRLGEGLFVRTWQEGDRFQPLGMTGEKKLQDFFVDEKVPRRGRGRVPLLCAADGRIAWVVGGRLAEPFKVTPASRRVLRVVVWEGT